MSTVSTAAGSYVENNTATQAAGTSPKGKVYGKTIGKPELSEKAAKYYEELKEKYSNMDFILVSKDQKQQAQAQAGNYASAGRMVVLIDEEKIEKMAEDENYRRQYEGIIQRAAVQMPQLQSSLAGTNAKVKTFGVKVNDNGTASYFAVIDKSLAAQRERIEKKREEKREEKKEAVKEAKKAEEKETETITITASSIEELIKKVNDTLYASMSDNAQTEEEKMRGHHIDYRM